MKQDYKYPGKHRDLILDPPAPKGGDTVLITAYVRNFSLKNTDVPVKAKFYLNNPVNLFLTSETKVNEVAQTSGPHPLTNHHHFPVLCF